MKKKDFNQGWLFGAVGKEPSMQPVTLPHDAMLYEKRSKDAATAGACGYFPGGAYVYVNSMYLAVPIDPILTADLTGEGLTLPEVLEAETVG